MCTANVLDTIPGPLLDRMEIIRWVGGWGAGVAFRMSAPCAALYCCTAALLLSGGVFAATCCKLICQQHPKPACQLASPTHLLSSPPPPLTPPCRLSGYIFDEKVAIARTYLEPQVRICTRWLHRATLPALLGQLTPVW